MATLSDLFVSYKAVEPTTKTETEDTETSLLGSETILGRLSRFNQDLEAAGLIDGNDNDNDDDDDDESEDEDEDIIENMTPQEFNWYIQDLYNEEPEVNTPEAPPTPQAFKPTGYSTRYNRGNLQKEIEDLCKKHGINIRVTSGKRPAGAAGVAGTRSHHVYGNAADIVPGKGETFESIRKKLTSNPEIIQFFYTNGLGVIDETDPKVMAKTHARGKHYHIGPDTLAVQTWVNWLKGAAPQQTNQNNSGTQKEWTKNIYSAFVDGLKKEYGKKYDDNTYKRIAAYMTYQAALESGYGKNGNGYNYAGHKRGNKLIHYDTMDEFVKAHIKTLQKWDFMNAKSLEDYINSLYTGDYAYNPSDIPANYLQKVKGTVNRINGYLNLSFAFGGKFTNLRQIFYEKNISQYRE